jgi:hypothetical protein
LRRPRIAAVSRAIRDGTTAAEGAPEANDGRLGGRSKTMETRTGGVGVSAVEVILSWQGTALDGEMIALESATTKLVVGPENARFLLPGEVAGDGFELVEREGDRFVLRIPAGAVARITNAGAAVEASSLPLLPSGERSLALEAGHLAEVAMEGFSFFVRPLAAAPEKIDRGALVDWTAMRWVGAALAFHGALLGMMLLAPPDASALSIDLDQDTARYLQVELAGPEITPPPFVPQPDTGTQSSGVGQSGASTGSQASAGGTERTPHVRGGRGRLDRGPTRQLSEEDVVALATIGIFTSGWTSVEGGESDSPYGTDAIGPGGPGTDADAGGIGGDFGGFDMVTDGVGTCTGDHCSDGTVAVGDLGTSDGGDGGHDLVTHLGPRRPHGPTGIRPVDADVIGNGLTREDVRRTVRNHISEVRFCYEQQLQGRPDLEGRVAVQFVVQPTGTVSVATVATATPGTDRVASCVSQAVRRWHFPSSNGITAVTYPFVMQSTQ